MGRFASSFVVLLALMAVPAAQAQARFDLDGPPIEIRVTRGGASLPIASVPTLQPGDTLWLHPDLPPTQSVHYLLIAAFLRGTTNPPPDSWFTRIETWKKDIREEGVTIQVPVGAQQAVLFLAPETIGDFSTLRSAVEGRPGIFVRATQDLTEASFEQARVERYLADMKRVPPSDAAALKEHSNLLARTLNLKPNADCFKRPLDQQYNCLTQTGSQTLLDDGHGQSLVSTLSSGSGSDFINAASTTRLAAGGNYSAYVGALVDFARLVSTLHTAQYQYIPAIAVPQAETLQLKLNTAPSFHNPKSVIVVGLPAVLAATPPPLRPADPNRIACLLNPHLVLPVEGAPLVFSTAFAHSLVLHLNLPPRSKAGDGAQDPDDFARDLPLTPDAFQGGLIPAPASGPRRELPLDPVPALGTGKPPTSAAPVASPAPGQTITGTVQGFWGFDRFTGPTLDLQQNPGEGWHIVGAADSTLIAGQPNHLQLLSSGTACIESIRLEPGGAKLDWKLGGTPDRPSATAAGPGDAKPAAASKGAEPSSAETKPPSISLAAQPPDPVELTLNLQHAATPGTIQLAIQQFGQVTPDQLGTRTFAQPARIQSLSLHAGDRTATLTGDSLDQVKLLKLKDLIYTPESSGATAHTRTFALAPQTQVLFKASEKLTGQVHLNDGRTVDVSAVVEPARPAVSLLSRRMAAPAASPILLASPDDLPLGDQLLFFLKSRTPFARSETVEIAQTPASDQADDDPLHTTLTLQNGLVLEDVHTVLATFNPLKTFGPSTFGPFRLRAVAADGTAGEWMPLTTIVRLPTLTTLTCPALPKPAPANARATNALPPVPLPCTLSGTALYLIESLSLDSAFTEPIHVPEGFVEPSLSLPRPSAGTFFLRLRDDPGTIQTVTMPIQNVTAPS